VLFRGGNARPPELPVGAYLYLPPGAHGASLSRMLIDQLKARMFDAIRERRDVEKEILRVAIGEITTDATRPGRKGSDEEAIAVVRRLLKSIEDSLAMTVTDQARERLDEERRVLLSVLPPALGEDQVVEALTPVADAVRSASGDGPAMGIAMKHLKASGLTVDGKVVAAAVRRVRG